jgi:hypothetical protein
MDSSIVDELDLRLAWQRMKGDRPDRTFYTHPRLIEWIELDLDGWFATAKKRLVEGYQPQTPRTCFAPKPGWLVRPGTVLDEQDELVFNALVGSFYGEAYKLLAASQGDPDAAFRVQSDATKKEWVQPISRAWDEWRTKSLEKLEASQFVVLADIAGFYENIDLQRLNSDLKSFCSKEALLNLLMKLLNRWAQPRAKGIPQGFSASDILAKIYLNPVDRALGNAGFSHLRFVDDFRIFCKSRLDAKRGLLLLNDWMRMRGLNLQSAKTKIVRADEARHVIDGVTPLINAIQKELDKELLDEFAETSTVTLAVLQAIFDQNPSSPRPEVLERAFTDNFGGGSERFNKGLLHYLLNRLGKVKSRVAIGYAVELLQQRPEETDAALRYLSDVGADDSVKNEMIVYISSPEAIYDYQVFQILTWFNQHPPLPAALLSPCREWSADRNRGLWLRTSARAILGRDGDQSDLETIENSYDVNFGDLECADIVDAMSRMEGGGAMHSLAG